MSGKEELPLSTTTVAPSSRNSSSVDEMDKPEITATVSQTPTVPQTPAPDNDGPKLQAISSIDDNFPPQKVVLLIMFGLFLAAFLVALDRLIIATAIPAITDQFNSLNDVGWYGSAYLLTACSFQLIIGRLYSFYSTKWVFLSCIGLFELGSLICGVAPSSTALIVGRAIAGAGSAGIFSGAIVIIVYTIPLHKRPAYTGVFGAVFGIASIVGPLLGGVFTDKISWRWCFYINLPIGAVTIAIIFFFLNLPNQRRDNKTLKEQFWQLDPYGTAVFLPSIVSLLLALQWGGTLYPWGNWRIILCLVIFTVTAIAFVLIQIWKQEQATLPPRIIKNRSVAAGTWFAFCVGASMLSIVYFLPIWFQSIQGVSAVQSGIRTIPMVLGLVIASITAGILTRKVGYYTPWMYVTVVLCPIGAGLLTTLQLDTSSGKWIGYQIIFGFGLGMGMQQPNVAAQTVLPRRDVSTGASFMFFSQSLGGALCVSIANNIFDNKLYQGLQGIPGINANIIIHTGATELRNFIPTSLLPEVLTVYNEALRQCFYVAVATTCAMSIGAAFMEWHSIKQGGATGKEQAARKAARDAAAATPVTAPPADNLEKKVEEV